MFPCEPGTTVLWRIGIYHILLSAQYDLILTNWPLPYSIVSRVRPYCDELPSTMLSCEPIATLLWRIDLYHILLWARYDLIVTNCPLPYSLVSPLRPYCDELSSNILSCKHSTTLLWRIALYHIPLYAQYDLIGPNCPILYSFVRPVRPYCDELSCTILSCKPSTTLLWRIALYHILIKWFI